MIKHVYPRDQKHNGVSLYGDYIDNLLPKVTQPEGEVSHFEIGYTGPPELWQAYQQARQKPAVPYVVTLHDPPGVVGRPYERYLPGRDFFSKSLRKTLDLTLGRVIIQRVVREAAAVIVLNPLAKPALIERYGLSAAKLFDSPLPVLTPLPAATKHDDKTLRLLFFGNVSERKGVDILLQACLKAGDQMQAVDWRLDVAGGFAGDHQYEQQLRFRIKESALAEHVELHGFVTEQKLADLITQADIIILSYDDSGIIHASGPLTTSLAAGRAVIATDIPIFAADIRDGYNGLLFPSGDIERLAAALIKLAADPTLRAKLGAAAADTIRRGHDDSTIIASLNKVYRSIRTS